MASRQLVAEQATVARKEANKQGYYTSLGSGSASFSHVPGDTSFGWGPFPKPFDPNARNK